MQQTYSSRDLSKNYRDWSCKYQVDNEEGMLRFLQNMTIAIQRTYSNKYSISQSIFNVEQKCNYIVLYSPDY